MKLLIIENYWVSEFRMNMKQLKKMSEYFGMSTLEKKFMHRKQWRITIKSSRDLKLICPAIT